MLTNFEVDSEYAQYSEPVSAASEIEVQGKLSDRDMAREEELDEEEANYWETIRRVKSFMACHLVTKIDTSSSFLDENLHNQANR